MEYSRTNKIGRYGLCVLEISIDGSIAKASLTGAGVDEKFEKTVQPGTRILELMPEILAAFNLVAK